MNKILKNICKIFFVPNFYIMSARAENNDNIFYQQDSFLKGITGGNENIFSKIMDGTYDFNFSDFLKSVINTFLGNMSDAKDVIITIVIISIMLALFQMTSTSLMGKEKSGSNPLEVFMMSVISVWIVNIINLCADKTANCIENVIGFMKVTLPVYAGVGVFTGKLTGTLYEYVFMILSGFLYGVVLKIIIPVISYISILSIISAVFDMEFGKTTYKSVHSTLKTTLEVIIALFASLYSVLFISGKGATFAGMGAVKFAVSKFIPMAGGFISDSADGIAGAFLGIKSTVGLTCAIGIMMIAYAPVLYIGAYALISKILVIVTSPLKAGGLTEIFKTLEDTLGMFFVLLICIATLFVITVSVLLSGFF